MLRLVWGILFTSFCLYTGWVYLYCDEEAKTTENIHPAVTEGWNLWQQNNCQSCHQLYGLGGYMGPDLTNIARDSTKGKPYMYTFIKHGTGRMPAFNMTDDEVYRIIDFLEWVDKSGVSQVPAEAVHWSGTYIIDK
ncbi:MAG: cytochrome c [Taibaiella sp.]|nr:cytochrome c [Taibaiella sp.]